MSETKMSEVLVHGVDAEPAREKEAVRRVSRIFLTRSKSADKIIKEILAGKNPADIKFITAKWIEKDEGSENPRQLMPAGGKIKPDETAEAAAIREALEETHLRAADVEGLGNIRYSFHHKKSNQELTVDETLFIGKILPSDVAYPLDPKEDKIAGFHDLDVDELAKLFEKGQINKESVDHALHLLGHLNVKDSEEKKDPKEVQIVLDKFIKKMRDKEIDKKKSIFKHLLGLMVQNDLLVHEGAEYWLEQFSIAGYDQQENEDFIRRFWEFFGEAKEIVPSNKKDASLKQNLLCRAVDLSNFEEEIESANKLGSNIEATIRSIYALLEAKYYSEHYLQIMAENEKMKGFVGGLTRFSEAISSGGETLEQKFLNLGKAKDKAEEQDKIVKSFLYEFGLDNELVGETLDATDSFLFEMHQDATKHEREKSKEEGIKFTFDDQLEEVKGGDVFSLLEKAFPSGKDATWKKKLEQVGFKNEEEKHKYLRTVVYEARRKLALLYVFKDAIKYYEGMKDYRSGELAQKRIWGKVYEAPLKYLATEKKYENHVLKDVAEKISDEGEGSPAVRIISNKYYCTMETAPMKELNSFLRKKIVRGIDNDSEIKDLYRRSIVLHSGKDDEADARLYTRDSQPIEHMDRIKGKGGKSVGAFNEIRAVKDVMEDILSQGEDVEIVYYDPTPRVGQKFASKGAGGGSKIRMCKFYVKFGDEQSRTHYEEVQVYLPSVDEQGNVKHASYYHAEKKLDDDTYKLNRLFDTKTMHSFVDLLYPPGVYGHAVRELFGSATKEKKKKKKW